MPGWFSSCRKFSALRVEGVAAVQLNQRRSEKWRENRMGRDYSGAAENACRHIKSHFGYCHLTYHNA